MMVLGRVATLIALALTPLVAPTAASASDIVRGALLPPFEVFTVLRSMRLEPAGPPTLRGSVYIVRAFDDDDQAVRVTVDARSGRVLTVTDLLPGDDYSAPARVGTYPMPPGRVPSVPDYRPEYGARPAPNYAARPAPDHAPRPVPEAAAPARPPVAGAPAATAPVKRPAVAARTPAPKTPLAATAPTTPAQTTGAIQDSGKPGKSIPAPVARSAAAPSASGSAAEASAQPAPEAKAPEAAPAAAPKTEIQLVPVAPLE